MNVQILASPLSAIPQRQIQGFCLCDLLANVFKLGSDTQSVLAEAIDNLNPTLSSYWGSQPVLKSVSNLDFIQFLNEGGVVKGTGERQVGARAGVYLIPRYAPLDCQIGDNADELDNGNTSIHWEEEAGTWCTLAADANRQAGCGTAIYNTGADVTARATTAGTLPANRCFRVKLRAVGGVTRANSQPAVRLEWGQVWSITLRHGQKAEIAKKEVPKSGGAAKWNVKTAFKDFGTIDLKSGVYEVEVLRIDGRLVASLTGANAASQTLWLFDSIPDPINPAATQPNDVNWPAAKLRLTAYACRIRAELAVIKWSTSGGASLTGTLRRSAKCLTNLGEDAQATATTGGWKREGTQTYITVIPGTGEVDYLLTLAGGPDGISCPFIDRATVRYAPVWTTPASSSMDLRLACESLEVNLGLPPLVAGAEATLNLDRNLLDQYCSGWQDRLKSWCPIQIKIQRQGAGYTTVFEGYVYKPDKSNPAFNDRAMTVALRDPIIRLSKSGEANHALINHRCPPLDVLFAEKWVSGGYSNGSPLGSSGSLYAAECVQFIVRTFLGDGYADSMNGDGNPFRFVPPDHPPMISTDSDKCGYIQLERYLTGNALTQSAFQFPPPFLQAALDWISELAEKDRCIFFFHLGIFFYGRYLNLIASRTARTISDQSQMLMAELQARPDKDVNAVYVVGPEAKGLEGLVPSFRMAEMRLPASDARSAEKSWVRHLSIREPVALARAEAIAAAVIQELKGVNIGQPSIKERGDERWTIGDLIRPDMSSSGSDSNLGLDAYYRTERITHSIDFSQGDEGFTTTLVPRPLSASEMAKAIEVHG